MRQNHRMGELTARVIDGINNSKESKNFANWIWMAGDLIRKASSPGFHSGFEEIDREEVSDEERQKMREAVLKALPRNDDPLYIGSLLQVLRQTYEKDLIPLWIEYLTKYLNLLNASNGVVWTILLALKEIGEPVFQDVGSLCSIDVERNVEEAHKYLRQRGINLPR